VRLNLSCSALLFKQTLRFFQTLGLFQDIRNLLQILSVPVLLLCIAPVNAMCARLIMCCRLFKVCWQLYCQKMCCAGSILHQHFHVHWQVSKYFTATGATCCIVVQRTSSQSGTGMTACSLICGCREFKIGYDLPSVMLMKEIYLKAFKEITHYSSICLWRATYHRCPRLCRRLCRRLGSYGNRSRQVREPCSLRLLAAS